MKIRASAHESTSLNLLDRDVSGAETTDDHYARDKGGKFKSNYNVCDYVMYKADGRTAVKVEVKSYITDAHDLDPQKGITSKLKLEWKDDSGILRTKDLYSDKYSRYIRKYDPVEDYLYDGPEKLIYQSMKEFMSRNEIMKLRTNVEEANSFNFGMLFENAAGNTSLSPLKALCKVVMNSRDAKTTIENVFGLDNLTDEHAILPSVGYLSGIMVGDELQHQLVNGTFSKLFIVFAFFLFSFLNQKYLLPILYSR